MRLLRSRFCIDSLRFLSDSSFKPHHALNARRAFLCINARPARPASSVLQASNSTTVLYHAANTRAASLPTALRTQRSIRSVRVRAICKLISAQHCQALASCRYISLASAWSARSRGNWTTAAQVFKAWAR